MGISYLHAELIIREHTFRPLPKTIHLMGRQTVLLSPAQMDEMLSRHGITPASVSMEIDRTTELALKSAQQFITDTTFFGLLGVERIRAIDHSDFEGADIILDLNKPIPDELSGTAQFIFGGSVLDNVFDPASYIRNLARLLKPGGRLVDQNAASFHFHPYVVVSPAWYYDFFVLNSFEDCKIYFQQGGNPMHVFGLEMGRGDTMISEFGSAPVSGAAFGVTILAEKGASSTWDRVPSQDQYRPGEEWSDLRAKLQRIERSPRLYETFGCPSADDIVRNPLRWTKSFRYLGALKSPNDRSFDGVIPPPLQNGLKIIEASYGMNLLGEPMVRPAVMPLCTGNVTDALARIANGRNGLTWTVDVNELGDPAPDMGKELVVSYTYLQDPERRLHEVRVPAVADGRQLTIPPFG